MDFSFSEEEQAVRDLAARIVGDVIDNDRLRELRAAGEHLDRELWRKLAEAGLIGIAVPEVDGGGGQGFLGVTLVLEQIGRFVAPVPYFASVVLAADPIARFGSAQQREQLLPSIIDGSVIATGAYQESGTAADDPYTLAELVDGAWRLTGQKDFVPAGVDADLLVVSARTEGGPALFVIEAGAHGVRVERQDTTTGIPEARIAFAGAKAELLTDDPDALASVIDRAMTGLCAIGLGVFETAVKLTAEYVSNRRQFDKPLANFQAVGQRAADAYIDTEAIRLTAWQAAWRLEQGLPSTAEVAIAKYWLAEGGQRVAAAAQHLHGGIGVDRAYPLHRYYLWAKWLQLALGGASDHLQRLGAMMATPTQ